MGIDVMFLQEKDQQPGQAQAVAAALAGFIQSARKSVHIAAYHFALKDPALIAPIKAALTDRAQAGVEVQIGYYFEHKGDPRASGGVSTPTGTEDFLGTVTDGLDVQLRPIRGSHLMHSKYVVRDGHTAQAAVWTGSTNFTDGAWKSMENNILRIDSADLCAYYENDFAELWKNEDIKGSGAGSLDSGTTTIGGAAVGVMFSPGRGPQMDQMIASEISAATRRIKVSSMVLSSATILGALADAVTHEQVKEFGGIYDIPETTGALKQATGGTPQLFAQIQPHLVGKASRHYNPKQPDADYDYMHNKIVVCDDVVITGSFNFSRAATMNAENVLAIRDQGLADQYSAYIDKLVAIYKA